MLAATVTSAQGPPDYTPSTTTVTSTVPGGGDDEIVIKISLKGTAGKQKVGKTIEVTVKAKVQDVQQGVRQSGSEIFVASYGKVALKIAPGGRGKQCRTLAKPSERKWKLGNDFDTISNGGRTSLKLKVPADARRAINKQAVCKNTKAKAKLRIRASTAEGAEGVKDRRVKVFPQNR